MLLEKIALKILFGLAALIVVFAVGYDLGSDRQKAKQIEAAVISQTDSNSEVLASQAKSVAVEEQAVASTQKIEVIKEKAIERIAANEPKVITKIVTQYVGAPNDSSSTTTEPNGETIVEVSRPWTFDNGTVRLLDAARSNDTDSTAGSSDDSDQAPSDITVGKFVKNDLEVVALYHEQSARLKSLQDYVKEKQEEGYMLCKPP